MIHNKENGISLYLTIIIVSLLLAISLGLSSILLGQIRTISGMGNSVTAFFAADTGTEVVLYLDKICWQDNCTSTYPYLYPTICPTCQGLSNGYSTSSYLISNILKYSAKFSTSTDQIDVFSMGQYYSVRRAIQASR